MRTIKVCLQDSATDNEVDTLIEWLQGVRCTGAVYEVKENAAQKSAQTDLLPCGHSVDSLGGFGGCNPNGSCMECAATSS